MKKITMKEAKKALKQDYIDALAFFAEYLGQFEEGEEMEDALEELDERVFDRSLDWGLSDEWLVIYSALRIAC